MLNIKCIISWIVISDFICSLYGTPCSDFNTCITKLECLLSHFMAKKYKYFALTGDPNVDVSKIYSESDIQLFLNPLKSLNL